MFNRLSYERNDFLSILISFGYFETTADLEFFPLAFLDSILLKYSRFREAWSSFLPPFDYP